MKMKKVLSILLIAVIAAGILAGCGGDEPPFTVTVSRIGVNNSSQGIEILWAWFINDDGERVSIPTSYGNWFENVDETKYDFEKITEDTKIELEFETDEETGIGAIQMSEGSYIPLILSVDGIDYEFNFGVGTEFTISKTKTGFILLP
jgi:ABC-type glycerol-3-phosphate transport system substrate-binding protein